MKNRQVWLCCCVYDCIFTVIFCSFIYNFLLFWLFEQIFAPVVFIALVDQKKSIRPLPLYLLVQKDIDVPLGHLPLNVVRLENIKT